MSDIFDIITGSVEPTENDALHYGTKYHSGRYPYGSGEDPYQHDGGLRGAVKELKDKGLKEKDIAQALGFVKPFTNEGDIKMLRDHISIEKVYERNIRREKALELAEKGLSYTQIGRELGTTDNAIRSLLDPILHERNNAILNTADVIKKEVDGNGFTAMGKGMAQRLGISATKLDTAVEVLKMQGYNTYNIPITQTGTNKKMQMKVIAPPGMSWVDCMKNKDKVNIVNDPYTEDGGKTWENIEKPRSIDSNRVYVKGKNEGGTDRDGLIQIRPGVEDLDIGRHNYAQVRIAVDDKKYMKGMAVYDADAFKGLPDNIDIIYNSNKDKQAEPEKVFKKMKTIDGSDDGPINWDNPFGAAIKADIYDDEGNLVREVGQKHYIDKNGKKQLSCINVISEAGNWQDWSKRLSSQMLSKQSPALAEKQLNLAYEAKLREFEEINALTNPEIKEKLLASFADDCDSAAVHLKAAPLPGQQSHAIIPFPTMKPNEIYAPNYPDGTIVSLIRHPHGGIFEIPTLVVNNRFGPARKVLGNAPDAVGIHPKAASQLSGADFDGDTVLVIPNPNGKLIKSMPGLDGLKDFDTKIFSKPEDAPKTGLYKRDASGKVIKGDGFHEQKEMGRITNLITDMTLSGAPMDEICRATKHSMVIIDAEKHNLDWKASEKEYDIAALRKKYQPNGGTGTLVSSAKSETRIPERKQLYRSMIDKETGEIHWENTNRNKKVWDPATKQYVQTDIPVTVKSSKMAAVNDAFELSSGTKIEAKYAVFANNMKALANKARKEYVNLQHTKYSPTAAKEYAEEVSSINAKLNNALKNKPLEMKAQAIADAKINQLKAEHEDWDKADIKKHKALILREARNRMGGGKRYRISLTDREWKAIKAGAISSSKITQILANTDLEVVRAYATPRDYKPKLSAAQVTYAKSLLASQHYTQSQIATMLGVSASTLSKYVNGKE